MDSVMRILAPRSWAGFLVRLAVVIGVVAAENILFARYFDQGEGRAPQSIAYYVLHATIVGGPLIAFFLAVTVYQVRLQRKLWRLSRMDGLTGLNNRRTFFELIEQAHRTKPVGVLLMLDADRFKNINDTYGHQAGDICLQSIAYTLRRSMREGDFLGRIGGEEYAIYLCDVSVKTARIVGERLTKPIHFQTEDNECLSVTLSIGAAQWPRDISIDAAFARADAALYRAKQNGRARIEFWEPQMLIDRRASAEPDANPVSM